MKVKCVTVINPMTGEETDRDFWLTKGKAYVVLAVEANPGKDILFRLVADDNSTPALFDSRQFRIVSGKIPSSWIANLNEHGRLVLLPSKWARPGFWEDYFDAIPEAVHDFEEEKDKLLAEAS